MKHCGIDCHLRSSTAEVVDDVTGEIARRVVPTTRDAITQWLSGQEQMRVVLEASTVSHWVAELVEELGDAVVVVDPNRTKAVAVCGGLKKTDKLDAQTLAWLSMKDALVPSYRPDRWMRELRRVLTVRQRLVRSRGDLVRVVRTALAGQGVIVRQHTGMAFVDAVRDLDGKGIDVQSLCGALRGIEVLTEQIKQVDTRVSTVGKEDVVVRTLMTVDGVGPVTATAFRTVIADPRRFHSGRQVAAYLGLVPAVHNSGDPKKNRLGSITKHGNSMVRSLLVEAAHHLLGRCRHPSDLRAWGLGVMNRVGRKKAVVALARKLCAVLWAMWLKDQSFRRCHLNNISTKG